MAVKTMMLASCGLCALMIGAPPVLAQNGTSGPELNASPVPGTGQNQSEGAAAPNQPTGRGQLEQVVVTAQKRRETAQRIPSVVAAISPATLSRTGVQEFETLNKVLPDVQISDVLGATSVQIRGIREAAAGPNSDSTAAVHLDGVYISRPTGLSGLFYDLQRIEELPGPQGTLYGRNATAGVINLITNKPSDKFGGYIEAEGGNYGLYRFNGALNLPVNDWLALRGAFHVYDHNGYFSNGLSDANETGGRLSARVKLNPDATLMISTDYQVSNPKGPGLAIIGTTYGSPPAFPPGVPGIQPRQLTLPSNPFQANPVEYPQGIGPQKEDSTTYGAMAQLDYDLGATILTAQLGVRKLYAPFEEIGIGGGLAQGPPGTPAPTDPGYQSSPAQASSYSAEVRLASKARLPFQWVAGVFYFTEKTGGDLCVHATVATFTPGCTLEIGTPFQRTISHAVFGQGTYTPDILGQKLHITGGARYNRDDKEADVFTKAAFAPPGSNGFLDNEPNVKASFQATTYRAELSYDVTAENLIYAQNSTGFRAGGIAFGLTPVFAPETIQAYEIGSKNRFFDNRLQVNLAGYHYIYKNQETTVMSLAPPGVPAPFSDLSVQSIGKAHYTGASLTLEYAITPDDRLETNIQYLDARYVRFLLPPQYVLSAPLGLNGQPTGQQPGNNSGQQVANTPPWSGTFAYDHDVHLLQGVFDGRAAVQFSDVQHSLVNYTNTLQYKVGTSPAYARLDLSLNYQPDSHPWQVTLYVNNVTNEVNYVGNQYEFQTTGSGLITANILPPRTYGVIVNAKF